MKKALNFECFLIISIFSVVPQLLQAEKLKCKVLRTIFRPLSRYRGIGFYFRCFSGVFHRWRAPARTQNFCDLFRCFHLYAPFKYISISLFTALKYITFALYNFFVRLSSAVAIKMSLFSPIS